MISPQSAFLLGIPEPPSGSFEPWLWNALLAIAIIGLVLNALISWRKVFGGTFPLDGLLKDIVKESEFSEFKDKIEDKVRSIQLKAESNEANIKELLKDQRGIQLEIASRLAKIEERSEMSTEQLRALFQKIDRCRESFHVSGQSHPADRMN